MKITANNSNAIRMMITDQLSNKQTIKQLNNVIVLDLIYISRALQVNDYTCHVNF